MRRPWLDGLLGRWRLVVVATLAASIAGLVLWMEPATIAARVLEWIPQRVDFWAIVAFVCLYVAISVCAIPAGAFSLYAGAWLGPAVGIPVVWLASTLGAAAAFVIGRRWARPWVKRWLRGQPRIWRRLDRAIERAGWRVVALLRLSLVMPFSLMNYLCSVTGIRFGPYLASTAVAMLPGNVLYVLTGRAARLGLDVVAGQGQGVPMLHWVGLGLGLAGTVASALYLARLGQIELKRQVHAPRAGSGTGPERDS